jgi:hypothetical protein
MPRNRRRPRGPASYHPPQGPTLAGHRIAPSRDWRWRTFPVYFTFGATLFLTAFLSALSTPLASWLWIIGAVVFASALSHLVSVYFVAPRLKPPRGG